MEDLFKNATPISENKEEEGGDIKPKSSIKTWFEKYKYPMIVIGVLVLALVIVSVVFYFKCNSVGTIICCKEDLIEGLNKELTKTKQELNRLSAKYEAKSEELEKYAQQKPITKEQKQAIKKQMNQKPEPTAQPKKRKEDIGDEIDSLVFNGPVNKEDDELEELPINTN